MGRQLARRLGLPFLDSDQAIEERLGCSIREFFEREGEDRFRDLEQETLELLTRGTDAVLSTGGGSVLRPANRACLRERTRVIYLRSQPEELFRRLRNDRKRPLLQVADPLQKLKDLYAQRDPLYWEAAHQVVETGRPSVSALVQAILAQLEAGSAPP